MQNIVKQWLANISKYKALTKTVVFTSKCDFAYFKLNQIKFQAWNSINLKFASDNWEVKIWICTYTNNIYSILLAGLEGL